jgi:hypothetical protein
VAWVTKYLVEEGHIERSGVWDPKETAGLRRPEPETLVLAAAWILAVTQIVIAVARGEAFGPDRAVAVAFALGCPLVWLRRR